MAVSDTVAAACHAGQTAGTSNSRHKARCLIENSERNAGCCTVVLDLVRVLLTVALSVLRSMLRSSISAAGPGDNVVMAHSVIPDTIRMQKDTR